MSAKVITKETVQASVAAVINQNGGCVSHRTLWDTLWSAAFYYGNACAEQWVREIARPDFEPPLPQTPWRLLS